MSGFVQSSQLLSPLGRRGFGRRRCRRARTPTTGRGFSLFLSAHTRHIASMRSHTSLPDIRLARLYLHQTDKIPVSSETGRRSSRVADYHDRRIGYLLHNPSLLTTTTTLADRSETQAIIKQPDTRAGSHDQIPPRKASRKTSKRITAHGATQFSDACLLGCRESKTGWLERDRSQQQ